jgi:hypothetical protein
VRSARLNASRYTRRSLRVRWRYWNAPHDATQLK